MAKIDIEEPERMNRYIDGWRQFGERLGWKLYRIDERAGREPVAWFVRHEDPDREDGKYPVGAGVRADIERTWREQDMPAVKVVGS